MAKMGGCNYEFKSASSPQGKGRVTPSTFSRNNLSKGGVNDHIGGTDKAGKKPALGAGRSSMIKAK